MKDEVRETLDSRMESTVKRLRQQAPTLVFPSEVFSQVRHKEGWIALRCRGPHQKGPVGNQKKARHGDSSLLTVVC